MSRPTVTVLSPRPGEVLLPVMRDGVEGFRVFIHVEPHDAKKIKARLCYGEGKECQVTPWCADGITRPRYRCDKVLFVRLTDRKGTPLPEKKLLELIVEAKKGNRTGRTVVPVSYRVPKRALTLEMDVPRPPPPDVEDVEPTFETFGFVSPTPDSMAATVTPQGGGQAVQGAPISPLPPPYDWGFRFTNLAEGVYTLTVEAHKSGETPAAVSRDVRVVNP
jgi:hypothetical protein